MKTADLSSLKIEHPPATLREIVQDKLRTAIIEGHFASGTRLVERPLCEQLGVSRTVVRETIRYLEAEGLVEILPNKGPIVARMDRDQARQIYEIRKLLESSAAAACAEECSDELRRDLSIALGELEAAYSSGETGVLFKTTTHFYNVIFEAAGHSVAWEVVQRLNGRISRLRAMTLATTDRHISGYIRMKTIFEAISNQSPVAAREAVDAHLSEASEIAQRLLAQQETPD